MNHERIEKLAAGLRKGALPAAQAWDIGAAVQYLVDGLASPLTTMTLPEARAAAKVLNQHRLFDHTRKLGEAWTAKRDFDATVTKHLAQAEINLSALDAAEKLLRAGLEQIKKPGADANALLELSEYEGLLGRTYKQRYVLTDDVNHLIQATDQYLLQYQANAARHFWHGINVAALLAREEHIGLAARKEMSSATLAEKILGDVTKLFKAGGADQWVAATASEAYLALGDCEHAELWLYRFLHHVKTRPFDLESYGRQLREIWRGDAMAGTSCADRLTAIMERHVASVERAWSFLPENVASMRAQLEHDPKAFEKNFSGEGYFSLDSLERVFDACASIACVCDNKGGRLGTGFLIPGSALKDAFGTEPVLVTNSHVLSDSVPKAIARKDARITFEVESAKLETPKFYTVGEVLFTSPPGDIGVQHAGLGELDVTVVRLNGFARDKGLLQLARALPIVEPKSRAFIVGHPSSSGLQISLHDSLLLDIDDDERLVHYRTPSDPGSSGSPVFNADWEVIALHHGGSAKAPRLHGTGSYEANEGIALSAVRRALVD